MLNNSFDDSAVSAFRYPGKREHGESIVRQPKRELFVMIGLDEYGPEDHLLRVDRYLDLSDFARI